MILHALVLTRLLALPEETRKNTLESILRVETKYEQHVASIYLLLQKASSAVLNLTLLATS